MCGFVGAFAKPGKAIDQTAIQRGMNLIAHRGPDDSRFIAIDTLTGRLVGSSMAAGNLGLGSCRLSIIDRSPSGAQPMGNADGDLWIVYNGEVYNHVELRRQYLADYPFRGRSDTEVILALYEREGPSMVSKLNGMFAFAIWDQRRGKIFFARDRMGIKPLYYTFAGDTLVFGSEIKALFAYPGVRRAIDARGFAEHFCFHFQMLDRTLFSDIHLLEAGTTASYENGTFTVERFWEMEFQSSAKRTMDAAAEELRHTLEQVIRRQVRSDVPVGSFLSGGMDTATITALAQPHIETLHTFTCGFDVSGLEGEEAYFDERRDSRALAEHFATTHHECEVVPGDLERLLPIVAWHLEDPRVGISYQVLEMAKTVRDSVQVVLSGTGGDELFGGYPWRYEQVLGADDPDVFDRIYYEIWGRILPEARHSEIFSDATIAQLDGFSPYSSYQTMMNRCTASDPLHRALFFDTRCFLHGILSVDDKLNMAHSVETRVPLLDNDLVDLVSALPPVFKYSQGTAKRVLKHAMRGILPNATLDRRKQGFTPPDKSWFRLRSVDYINSLLLDDRFLSRGWFRPEAVQQLLDEHMTGTHNHRFLIWSMMMFEWVHRLFLDTDAINSPKVEEL